LDDIHQHLYYKNHDSTTLRIEVKH